MNRTFCTMLMLALLAAPVTAQEPPRLDGDAVAAIAAFHNHPRTTRITGDLRIAAGTILAGDIAVIGGPVVVTGEIRGGVVVINGDLRLPPAGRIDGDVTVVGGRFDGVRAGVGGRLTVYPEPLRFRREGDRIVVAGPARTQGIGAGVPTGFGRTDFRLNIDGSYNRVEGLPISMGPRIERGYSNPTVLDARLIYRTRSGLRIHPNELGHSVRLEQSVGGHRAIVVGVGAHRVVDPIQDGGLTDTENSLATFVLHQDHRDHYSRRGWSGYFRYQNRTLPYDAGLEYRDERHLSVQSGAPWALLKNDHPWRLQPRVAEGDLRSIRGWLNWDTRNDRLDPSTGWLVRAEAEQGLSGELTILVREAGPSPFPGPALVERPVSTGLTTVRLDARRYLRLGPRSRVALRGVFDGAPDDDALPPQRQRVLGGEGSLPTIRPFGMDCGARATDPDIDDFYPYYGCDRAVLFQAEYGFAILTGESLGRRLGLDFDLVTTPELVLFVNAGRAWIESGALGHRQATGPGHLHYDGGVGLRLGRVGIYLAAPIAGEDGDWNFFVRLGPRL